MRLYFLLILILALILSSCNDDELIGNREYETCDVVVPNCSPSEFIADDSGVTPIVSTSECYIDEGARNLGGITKQYLWFYCTDINALVFEDSLGNDIEMQITRRKHVKENIVVSVPALPACQILTTESIDEIIELELQNEEINIRFRLVLKPGKIQPIPYDILEVHKATFDDDLELWSNIVMRFFLNHNISDELVSNSFYSTTLDITGQEYDDVYFCPYALEELYYNRNCGLIAFRDDNEVFWRFKDVILD